MGAYPFRCCVVCGLQIQTCLMVRTSIRMPVTTIRTIWRSCARPKGTLPNSVLVQAIDSPCVETVLYTDFRVEGKIRTPTPDDLAKRAVESVGKANEGRDGISYLNNAIESGIQTPLTQARTIGIDTGKNTLHMIGLDEKGTIVLREKIARGRIAARLVNVPSLDAYGVAEVGADADRPPQARAQQRNLASLCAQCRA